VPTASPTLTTTPTVTPTKRPTNTPLPTAAAIEPPLPDILINVSPGERYIDCAAGREIKILYSKYPYEDYEEILSDDTLNYSLPTWAPSGSQFAYLQTEYTSEMTDEENYTYLAGEDTIWLYDLNSYQSRLLSPPLLREEVRRYEGCMINKYIPTNPVWSPDERYLAYEYFAFSQTGVDIEYYVADLDNGNSALAISQSTDSSILWTANSDQILTIAESRAGINVFGIAGSLDVKLSETILPPSERYKVINFDILDKSNDLLVFLIDEE
jgi:hypothetical protein